jgi:hypothetical protein
MSFFLSKIAQKAILSPSLCGLGVQFKVGADGAPDLTSQQGRPRDMVTCAARISIFGAVALSARQAVGREVISSRWGGSTGGDHNHRCLGAGIVAIITSIGR